MTDIVGPEAASAAAKRLSHASIGLSAVGWASAEIGRLSYVALISISLFIPYFATVVVGDPVEGQAVVALMGTLSGVIAGFTAPVLGVALDAVGPRKPWLALGTLLMAILLGCLWWTKPHGAGLSIPVVVALLVAVKVLYTYTEVLHNALLPVQTDARSVHRLSALGTAFSSFAGMSALIFALWAFSLPGQVDWPLVPKAPLFGLDRAAFETSRIAGPLSGALLVLSIIPLLLLAKDYPRVSGAASGAIAKSIRSLVALPRRLRDNPDGLVFLIVRVIFGDGVTALMILGGVYAAGVMHWGANELLILGVARMMFGGLGGLLAGYLDEVLGCKRALQVELIAMIFIVLAMIGTTPDTIAYFHFGSGPLAPSASGALFSTWPERFFFLCAIGIGLLIQSTNSSSRSFVARTSPEAETGAYFGLYAMAGSGGSWLSLFLIGIATEVFKTQQVGIAPVIIFLLVGVVGLFFVKSRADGLDATPVSREVAAHQR